MEKIRLCFSAGAPQNTIRKPIKEENVIAPKKLMKENNINNVVIHAPYIINLANETKLEFGVSFLKQELKRANTLGINKVVLHPGSHVGQGIDKGIDNIIKGLNEVLDNKDGPIICLETMAGKGTKLGTNFKELSKIIKNVKNNNRLMVCLDTCHMNDAGYDLTNLDQILEDFDQIIGIEKIGCIHINDSKNIKGSHKDRHENIGMGKIGFDTLLKIIYHKKLKEIPKILETPYINKTYPPYKAEIEMIKNKKFKKLF